MNKEELIEKLMELENRFCADVEVNDAIKKLKERFDAHFNEAFTQEEIGSDEFDEMCEGYYSELRECDPDDASIFQVLWFK